MYLVALGGISRHFPMAALAGAARVKVDFEAKAIRREPLARGMQWPSTWLTKAVPPA